MTSWDTPLLASLTAAGTEHRPGSLAGLAAAREQHQGQFWTPLTVSRWLAGLLQSDLEAWCADRRPGVIVDPCVGSGRLLTPWSITRHRVFGVDRDRRCIAALEHATAADDQATWIHGSWLDLDVCGTADLALINPPYSLHWDHPQVVPLPCCSHGRHGPASSTLSHCYLVHHACRWARVVAAIVTPKALATICDQGPALPLRAVYQVPAGTFRAEGTLVETVIAIFAHGAGPVMRCALDPQRLAAAADRLHDLQWSSDASAAAFTLVDRAIAGQPAVTAPVTHDPTVRLVRNGRWLRVRCACAITEVLVMNAIYGERLADLDAGCARPPRRHPGLVYDGEGRLDLERLMAQDRPLEAWESFCERLRAVGAQVRVDSALMPWLRRRLRRLARARTSYGQWVCDRPAGARCQATVQRHLRLGQGFAAPVLAPGTVLEVTRGPEGYSVGYAGRQYTVSAAVMTAQCQLNDHPPRWLSWRPAAIQSCPQAVADLARRARRLGLDRLLSWGYQWEDFLEIRAKHQAGIVAWEMGLGKARLALALCLMGGRHNLIVVEAHLIDEMLQEVMSCGLDAGLVQAIRAPADLAALRRINLISYARLRRPLVAGIPKHTYGRALRRRCHTVVCDEVHCIRHDDTAQARAVWALSPRRRYGLTGTPIANYPRDVLPLLIWVGGDATAGQPYGRHHPHCDAASWQHLWGSRTSAERFMDDFITMEWVTNEFAEDLQSGAKREVPRLRNPDRFRHLIAPFIKRRVAAEPEVACHVQIPVPTVITTVVPWDDAHLLHYLSVAEAFAAWYRSMHEDRGRKINLVALLARIAAVQAAVNCPDHPVGEHAQRWSYLPQTSKHRAVVDRCGALVAAGHRAIIFAQRPATVERLAALIRERSIECLTYHGGVPTGIRNRRLYSRFVHGSVPILVATMGACQTGLNLYQADRVLFYERAWDPKSEHQAAARVLRPQQRRPVIIERFHLEGSLDVYQDQLVRQKWAAAQAGLDAADQPTETFEHLDTLLGRYVDELARFHGVRRSDLTQILQQGAVA